MSAATIRDNDKSLTVEIHEENVSLQICRDDHYCDFNMSHEDARQLAEWLFFRVPVADPVQNCRSCVMCRWHIGTFPAVFCRHPASIRHDPVSGQAHAPMAHSQRVPSKGCGPDGLRWEAIGSDVPAAYAAGFDTPPARPDRDPAEGTEDTASPEIGSEVQEEAAARETPSSGHSG